LKNIHLERCQEELKEFMKNDDFKRDVEPFLRSIGVDKTILDDIVSSKKDVNSSQLLKIMKVIEANKEEQIKVKRLSEEQKNKLTYFLLKIAEVLKAHQELLMTDFSSEQSSQFNKILKEFEGKSQEELIASSKQSLGEWIKNNPKSTAMFILVAALALALIAILGSIIHKIGFEKFMKGVLVVTAVIILVGGSLALCGMVICA